MSKDDIIELNGQVLELLPDATFRVKLENNHEIIAYTSGKMRKNRIRVLVGDMVGIELSIYDLTRGRVVKRHKEQMENIKKGEILEKSQDNVYTILLENDTHIDAIPSLELKKSKIKLHINDIVTVDIDSKKILKKDK